MLNYDGEPGIGVSFGALSGGDVGEAKLLMALLVVALSGLAQARNDVLSEVVKVDPKCLGEPCGEVFCSGGFANAWGAGDKEDRPFWQRIHEPKYTNGSVCRIV